MISTPEIILKITPSINVTAKPLTVAGPTSYRTTPAIRVVICPSIIADNALWKPDSHEILTDLPALISSLILENMITLASTAIPMPSMIPAIPGSVSVLPENAIAHNTSIM